MYCPTCGNEIAVELKYCNRCGANLSLPMAASPVLVGPVRLTGPTVVLGLTITAGLGIIFAGAAEFVRFGLHPAAIAWIVLFSTATLFGSIALLIRFFSKIVTMQSQNPQPRVSAPLVQKPLPQQLPPRQDPVPSVTEHTTRTFTPVYRDVNK
ncbi:MAG TPA: zinc ribbon domain-containing protein [Pyrinomonadaceae bacterium]|nr:zinc ribbon domain-containing protein [Pyrinomonadaceae bacterium]